jgi:hypothetical protein
MAAHASFTEQRCGYVFGALDRDANHGPAFHHDHASPA